MKEKGEKMTKRIVVLLGVLLSTVPAMANDYYQANGPGYTCDGDDILSGLDLNETNVTMLAQYAPHCTAGNYLLVDTNNPNGVCTKCYDSENPNATTNLATGTYCPSMTSVTLNSDGMPITQGWDTCPLGYRNGDSASSVNGCVKYVTCDNMCNNFNNYASCSTTDNTTSLENDGNGHYITTFRDVNAYCFANAIHADGYRDKNVYEYAKENPQVFGSWSYCSIDGSRGNCTGANAMERGTWVINAANTTTAPIKAIHGVAVCNDTEPDFSNPEDLSTTVNAGSGFSGNTTGANCWVKVTDFPNQPWFVNNSYRDTAECMEKCGTWLNDNYATSGNNGNPFGTDEGSGYNIHTMSAAVLGQLATYTASVNTPNIFVANPITVSWKANVAGTINHLVNECTYGGNLTAPSDKPNPADYPEYCNDGVNSNGCTFLGWKVQQ